MQPSRNGASSGEPAESSYQFYPVLRKNSIPQQDHGRREFRSLVKCSRFLNQLLKVWWVLGGKRTRIRPAKIRAATDVLCAPFVLHSHAFFRRFRRISAFPYAKQRPYTLYTVFTIYGHVPKLDVAGSIPVSRS